MNYMKRILYIIFYALFFFEGMAACSEPEGNDPLPPLPDMGDSLVLSQPELVFDADGKPLTLTITSGCPWSIDIPEKAAWLTVSPAEGGSGETEVTFAPLPFVNREPRGKELVAVNYGETSTFLIVSQTMPNESPTAPELLYPAEGGEDVPINAVFQWKAASDPDGDELTYELQVSPDGGVTWGYTAVTDATTAQLENFLNMQFTYTWRVKATDPFGGEAVSEAWSFHTSADGGYADGEVVEWQHETAGALNPVHFIFTGDGYVAEDYMEGGVFERDMQKAVDAIFSVEPYATYRDYFRISAVAAHSEERGTTILEDMGSLGPPAQERNTVFKTVLEGGGNTGTTGDYDKVFEYAQKVPGVTKEDLPDVVVFVLINVDAYAGTSAVWSSGRAIAFCPMGTMLDGNSNQPAFKSIIVHEGAGHAFGKLLDEYMYYDEPVDAYSKEELSLFRKQDPYYGWNISLTGDRNAVHWNAYFSLPGYGAVGMYEGGLLYTQGVWRPEAASCMGDNRPYFNAPSREAIVRRICRIAGETFDFNAFVAKDKVKSDNTGLSSGIRAWRAPERFAPLAPPVLIME